MAVVLVGVHGTAEHEDGCVVVDRSRRRSAPRKAPLLDLVTALLGLLAEGPRWDIRAMDDGEYFHSRNFTVDGRRAPLRGWRQGSQGVPAGAPWVDTPDV